MLVLFTETTGERVCRNVGCMKVPGDVTAQHRRALQARDFFPDKNIWVTSGTQLRITRLSLIMLFRFSFVLVIVGVPAFGAVIVMRCHHFRCAPAIPVARNEIIHNPSVRAVDTVSCRHGGLNSEYIRAK